MDRAARDLAVQYAVTNALATATTVEAAAQTIVSEILRVLGWKAGAVWLVDGAAGVLRCAASGSTSRPEEFAGVNAAITFPPGIGLPGRVWSRREGAWITDVTGDTNFMRRRWAEKAGVHGAFGVPISARNEVIGVLEFFHPDVLHRDLDLLQLLAAVGAQLGQAIERLRAREALTASEARLRAIVEGAPDAVISIDQDSRIIEWNRQAEALFGWRREEVLQRALPTTIIPERYRDRHRAGIVKFLRTGEGPLVNQRVEIEGLHKSGREIPLELSITPVSLPDRYMFSAFVRSIADRRRYEDRLRFLAEASAVLASSLDLDTTLTGVTQLAIGALADICIIHVVDDAGMLRCVAATSSDPNLEFDGTAPNPPGELDPGGDHPATVAFRTRRSLFFDSAAGDESAARGGGSRHAAFLPSLPLLQWLCAPLIAHDEALGVIGFAVSREERRWTEPDIGLAEEIASRAALAIENARLYRQTRDAVRTRDDFLSTVSHDLRNPLASIKGLAQLLHRRAQRFGTPETLAFVESLARIDAAASRMTTLLDELVEVSGLRIGQPLELARHPVDLVALARDAAGSVRSDGHTIEVDANETAVVANGDPGRLQRVLMNLIANAVKYSRTGARVHVSVGREDNAAVVVVRDEGRGIPAADLPFIFERFRRGSNVEGISGTGIGLTAAKQIVELHGGSIGVESAEGVGSTFTVRLPLDNASR